MLVFSCQLLGCGGGGDGAAASPGQSGEAAPLSELAQLGELIFHDPSLSASGRLACTSCHDAAHALADPGSGPVSLGGPGVDQQGTRNAPSLRYVAYAPAFSIDASGAPAGGFFRDGRAPTLAEQARGPLLDPREMANASVADVADKLARADYAPRFRALFGATVFDDAEQALDRALLAVQRYEQEDTAEFAPFTSKYDAFLAGRAQLADQELRGLALFNDPVRGNCAACHPSGRNADGTPPLFTDFSYDNLGVPRNAAIAANSDPAHFDLGLCGPARSDLAQRADLCGAFKVPTLRNIALTAPYFHNGRFATLREAIGFYVRRDTNPEEWYPAGSDGVVRTFDDLPAAYRPNVNTSEVPYDRRRGEAPALTPGEIEDVVAFLDTLTDGYLP
jgi:cytochrome c peroxidase